MIFLIYFILGIIQGFTEPIPVSSSGHSIIFKEIFNIEYLSDLNFEIIVNFGSLIAVCFFYRKELIILIKEFYLYIKTRKEKYKENFKYCIYIIIGTIPAGIFGLIYKDMLENITNITTVSIALLMTGGLLYIIRNLKGEKNKLNYKDAIYIGFYQVLALLPGISRSGATIVGGMFRNLKREIAFKFSFFLYIPISVATMILGTKDLINTPNINSLILPYLLGLIASTIVTYFSLKWFKKIMLKGKLIYFAIYCFILGLIGLMIL